MFQNNLWLDNQNNGANNGIMAQIKKEDYYFEKIEPIMSRFEPIMSRLNERQKKVISYLTKEKRITRLEYLGLVHTSAPTAKRDLKDLIEKKVLVRKGKGRSVYYVFR